MCALKTSTTTQSAQSTRNIQTARTLSHPWACHDGSFGSDCYSTSFQTSTSSRPPPRRRAHRRRRITSREVARFLTSPHRRKMVGLLHHSIHERTLHCCIPVYSSGDIKLLGYLTLFWNESCHTPLSTITRAVSSHPSAKHSFLYLPTSFMPKPNISSHRSFPGFIRSLEATIPLRLFPFAFLSTSHPSDRRVSWTRAFLRRYRAREERETEWNGSADPFTVYEFVIPLLLYDSKKKLRKGISHYE